MYELDGLNLESDIGIQIAGYGDFNNDK